MYLVFFMYSFKILSMPRDLQLFRLRIHFSISVDVIGPVNSSFSLCWSFIKGAMSFSWSDEFSFFIIFVKRVKVRCFNDTYACEAIQEFPIVLGSNFCAFFAAYFHFLTLEILNLYNNLYL